MKRIEEFDGLRALAVGLVILDHYAPFRNFADHATARYGGLGVDVFFVLSGFLITTVLFKLKEEEEHPYRVFYARRSLRILPPYLLLLLCVCVVGLFLQEPIDGVKLAGQLAFLRSFKGASSMLLHFTHILQDPTHLPGLFSKMSETTIARDYERLPMSGSLGPTWSLSVEEWFYIVWAPIVLLLSRRVVVRIGLGACASALVLRWMVPGVNFFTCVDIMVTGALLASWVAHRETLSDKVRKYLDLLINTVSGASLVALIALSLAKRPKLSGTLIELVVFGALAWIIRHTGEKHTVQVALRWRPLMYLGSISYMIYLIHLPSYFVMRRALDGLTVALPENERMWIVALSSIAVTIALSALSWRYFEGPLLQKKDGITRFLSGARNISLKKSLQTADTKVLLVEHPTQAI